MPDARIRHRCLLPGSSLNLLEAALVHCRRRDEYPPNEDRFLPQAGKRPRHRPPWLEPHGTLWSLPLPAACRSFPGGDLHCHDGGTVACCILALCSRRQLQAIDSW